MRSIRSLVLLLLLALPAVASGQNADILTGKVTGGEGEAVVGARVTVISIETEISRSTLTDKNGRYMIVFPDGGGRYIVRIQMIGMADVVKTVLREGDEELLLTNIAMQPQAIQLQAITVTAQGPPPGQARSGEASTELPQEMLNRLPLPDLDPATLALLAAGVVGTGADSLSGRLGFSVAGMSDLLNQIVLDGVILGEGGLTVPEEGLRRTQVTTSTFDASRGGFAGGQVSMTTARGNNRTSGSLAYTFNNDALQFSTVPTANAFSSHNIGGNIGGPLLRNKLFYNFSFAYNRRADHRFALSPNDPQAAQRSGVAVDSISRFINILGNDYGFPTTGTGAYNQFTNDVRPQLRVDWNITEGQTLSARFNANRNNIDSTRISTLDLAQHGGESDRSGNLAAVTWTSRFRQNWTNNLAFSFQENWTETFPYLEMPEGRVRVTSDFDDGTRQTNTLVFGGSRNMPTEAYSKDLQLTEDLSFLLPINDQIHRLKVGASLQKAKSLDRSTDNLFGSFTFNSLEDFETNRPESFTRSLTERRSRTGTFNGGIYIGDTWRISQPLELTLGLRWDYSALDQKPRYNPLVEEKFGRRTDIDPKSSGFTPRIGFNYRLNQPGQPARSLSGGIGWFAGRPPTNIFSAAVRQTGLPDAEQSLRCIGSAVPIPDWDLYIEDPFTVPTTCTDGGPGVPSTLSSRAPTVTLINPDQTMPSSLRFDVGYRTQIPVTLPGAEISTPISASVRYTFSHGYGLWGYYDLNLDQSRTFALGDDGRPFYGEPTSIVARTGATSLAGSRLFPEFGNVYEVRSDRESNSHQVTTSVNGFLPGRITMSLNYTLGFARDQGSGSFQAATTASNPNVAEWSTSSNDRRHTLNLTLSHAILPELEVTAIGRLSSGAPFTPIVNRDINGDGASRNDRAFVFDPSATADTAIANSMNRLLASAPERVAACLESQLGEIADRNSCRNSWTQNLDMRASFRPNLANMGLGRRLTLSLDGRNVLSGLDQLFNGSNLKGWGESRSGDATLLEVRGFDRTSRAFIYEVNEGFGQTRRGQSAFRSTFQLTLSGRLAIGGQPFQNNRGFGPPINLAGFGGGEGRGGGGGGIPGFGGPGGGDNGINQLAALFRGIDPAAVTVDSILNRALINPVPQIITFKDTIGL